MKNSHWLYALITILTLLLGITGGYLLLPEKIVLQDKIVYQDKIIEKEVIRTINQTVDVPIFVYRECNIDENKAEAVADDFEAETGRKIFTLKSTRDCSDFLTNSYIRPDKEIISYVDVSDGCVVYYAIKV